MYESALTSLDGEVVGLLDGIAQAVNTRDGHLGLLHRAVDLVRAMYRKKVCVYHFLRLVPVLHKSVKRVNDHHHGRRLILGPARHPVGADLFANLNGYPILRGQDLHQDLLLLAPSASSFSLHNVWSIMQLNVHDEAVTNPCQQHACTPINLWLELTINQHSRHQTAKEAVGGTPSAKMRRIRDDIKLSYPFGMNAK